MVKKYNIIGFIPARSGSTRVKNKNIRLINGRPLIYWTVFKALKSKKFDQIIFSSDSSIYYNTLIKYLKKDKLNYNNLVFDKRDIMHSATKSKIFDYLKFDLLKKFNLKKNDLLVQMLPTCPLRKISTIKKIVSLALRIEKNIFSVSEYNFHVSFAISLNKLKWKPLFKNSPFKTGNTQSQTQKVFYHPNGVINCLYVGRLSKKSKSIYENAVPVIVSRKESYDLDTPDDLYTIQKLLKNKN